MAGGVPRAGCMGGTHGRRWAQTQRYAAWRMRILLLSDIQGNLAALDAVLADALRREPDAVVVLGDIACGPASRGVIDRVRGLGGMCVRGNMDDVIASPTDGLRDTTDAFAAIDRWAADRIGPAARRWLGSLPLTLELELPGARRMTACHGSPRSNAAVIGADTSEAEVYALVGDRASNVIAVGHLHEPMQRQVGPLLVVNPGSVGWPDAADRGRRPLVAFYAFLDATVDGLDVAMHHVEVGASELRAQVAASGMPHPDVYLAQWALPAGRPGFGTHGMDASPEPSP